MECFGFPAVTNPQFNRSLDVSGGFGDSSSNDSSHNEDNLHGQSFPSNPALVPFAPLDHSSGTSFNSDSFGSGEDTIWDNRSPSVKCGMSRYRVFGHDIWQTGNTIASSPTPQQVSCTLAPFVHVGPAAAWNLQQWQPGQIQKSSVKTRNSSQSSYKSRYGAVHEPSRSQRSSIEVGRPECFRSSRSVGRPRPRPRLSTCDDPRCDLMKNGREVAMDAVDVMQVKLREGGQLRRVLAAEINGPSHTGWQKPLKVRLAQVRAMIREELEEQAVADEISGFCGRKRKDKRHTKKCKFCLSKKEGDDIVTHHNLFDHEKLVACPILQQYECELCHATGRYAHTIKYCPENNPDTPHDVILQARLKVMLRNRRGQ